jgi:hypothetical protein
MVRAADPVERFWSRVTVTPGCWSWSGYHDPRGYGRTDWPGTKKHAGVHVVTYTLTYGPVPAGLVLDHFVCDNTGCCNPDHVRPTTQRENVLRGSSPTSWNLAKSHCIRGHLLAGANLYIDARGHRKCRRCHADEQARRPKIQRQYVTRPTVGWDQSVIDEVCQRVSAGERKCDVAEAMGIPRQSVSRWTRATGYVS